MDIPPKQMKNPKRKADRRMRKPQLPRDRCVVFFFQIPCTILNGKVDNGTKEYHGVLGGPERRRVIIQWTPCNTTFVNLRCVPIQYDSQDSEYNCIPNEIQPVWIHTAQVLRTSERVDVFTPTNTGNIHWALEVQGYALLPLFFRSVSIPIQTILITGCIDGRMECDRPAPVFHNINTEFSLQLRHRSQRPASREKVLSKIIPSLFWVVTNVQGALQSAHYLEH
jgi:hypothetical protein